MYTPSDKKALLSCEPAAASGNRTNNNPNIVKFEGLESLHSQDNPRKMKTRKIKNICFKGLLLQVKN